jgi:hypothetical protein
MIRDIFRPWTRMALAAMLAGSILSCGGDDIVFPGDDDDDDDKATVTVTGNIDDVLPLTARDIVVFVVNVDNEEGSNVCVGGPDDGDSCETDEDCAGDGDCASALCPCPAFPDVITSGKTKVLENGETEFTVSDIENGAIKVVFLLDNPGDDADGTIDEGDPIAVLDDEDCEIDDVDGELTVTLSDVDIFFSESRVVECLTNDPPLPGRARADLITQERSANSGD